MNFKAWKKIGALLLALTLVLVPMSVSATGDDPAEAKVTEELVAEILPDLSNLEKGAEHPENGDYPTQWEEPEFVLAEVEPVADDLMVFEVADDFVEYKAPAVSAFNFQAAPTVGSTKVFTEHQRSRTGSRSNFNAEVLGVGTNVVLWIDKSAPEFAKFKNQQLATDLLNEFETVIYPTATSTFGAPIYRDFMTDKVNIVLYDMNQGLAGGLGGYFYSLDYYKKTEASNTGGSNENAIVYVDISTGGGYKNITIDPTLIEFASVIAHEFEHLIGGGRWNQKYLGKTIKTIDNNSDEDGMFRAVWLEEGLSGISDIKYRKAKGSNTMSPSHLQQFLLANFGSGVGYTPKSGLWEKASATGTVVANYGSVSMLSQEFAAAGGNIKGLVDDDRYGYRYSYDSYGDHSASKNFDEFFELAVVDTSVALDPAKKAVVTGLGETAYISAIPYDVWGYRGALGIAAGAGEFAGIKKLNAGNNDFSSGGRVYFSTMMIAGSVGATNNAAQVNVPAGADYYIITSANETAVNDTAKWVATPKIARKLAVGDNQVIVGKDNRFAVVSINYNAASSGSVAYQPTAVKAISVAKIVLAPTTITAGDAGQTATIDIVTDMIADGQAVTAELVKAADDSAAPGTLTVTNNTIAAGKASVKVAFGTDIVNGVYKIKLTADGAFTLSPEIIVSMTSKLSAPADQATGVSAATASIDIEFGGAAKIGGDGQVIVTETGGAQYSYKAVEADLSGTKAIIPVSGLVSAAGEGLVLNYSKTYTVEVEADSFRDINDTPVAAKVLGSFTVEGEPSNPSVLPKAMNMAKGEVKKLLVYFGAANNHTSATLTIDNDKIATLSDTNVTASGTAINVTGVARGKATITIGFSGTTEVTETVVVEVTEAGSVTPNYGYSSSSRNTGGTTKVDVSPHITAQTKVSVVSGSVKSVTSATAKAEVEKAIKALPAGTKQATVKFRNAPGISKAVLAEMAKQAKAAGVTLTTQFDTIVDKKVAVRVSLNPAEATKDLDLTVSMSSARAVQMNELFKKWYSNDVAAISFGQQGGFGQKVTVSVLTPAALDNAQAKAYTFNAKDSSYNPLSNANVKTDTKGYVSFSTEQSGDMVISEGTLAKIAKEVTKEVAKEVTKEVTKEATKEVAKEVTKEATKEVAKETTKEVAKETTKEVTKK